MTMFDHEGAGEGVKISQNLTTWYRMTPYENSKKGFKRITITLNIPEHDKLLTKYENSFKQLCAVKKILYILETFFVKTKE